MVKIENGRFSETTFIEDIVGKKIVINKYRNQEGYRLGYVESTNRGKHGYTLLITFNDECHFNEKSISRYCLHNIEDAVIFMK